MTRTLLACILIAVMGNGCLQRQQNRLIHERLDGIDKILKKRTKIEITIPPVRPLGSIDPGVERDT